MPILIPYQGSGAYTPYFCGVCSNFTIHNNRWSISPFGFASSTLEAKLTLNLFSLAEGITSSLTMTQHKL